MRPGILRPPVCEYAALNAALHNIEKKKKKKLEAAEPSQLGGVAVWRQAINYDVGGCVWPVL